MRFAPGPADLPGSCWVRALLPVCASTAPLLLGLTATGVVPLRGMALIPSGGILIGASMTPPHRPAAGRWTSCGPGPDPLGLGWGLPGAFVGMPLGDASPIEAGAVQLLVLVGLLTVQALAVSITAELVAAGCFPEITV
ncbi:MAG TPA: ABC transporter permease [Pseudonocardiaceae bacterium]|nr:ABC transporter permease [Pseudonocardiaceae bacterium]